jgi:hypothetical protein
VVENRGESRRRRTTLVRAFEARGNEGGELLDVASVGDSRHSGAAIGGGELLRFEVRLVKAGEERLLDLRAERAGVGHNSASEIIEVVLSRFGVLL